MKKTFWIITFLLLGFYIGQAQEEEKKLPTTKKELTTQRIETPPKIDGFINEQAWKKAEIATDFVEISPNPLTASEFKTEVRVLYDDAAVYISFRCFDESGDVVLRQLSQRDDVGNADWVLVVFNSYQDGLNGEGFLVTASGVQRDVKFAGGDDDDNWNAVWDSEVQILEDGWSAEMKIPYAALRFPEAEEQEWNINFGRSIRRTREESWWSPIDPKIDGLLIQLGKLKGIKNIKPPTRLFLYPYISANAGHFPHNVDGVNNWSRGFNAGMDLKYGINDAFTLDLTLIPDFGTVRSDNQVLNLGPFEVIFDENRQFFTEGTELFNKGDLFYSRRIGARPSGYGAVEDEIGANETLVNNPSVTQLINSSKISGRTNSGLGVGFFNSVTNEMNATIRNENGDIRKFQTEPLTNYNIMVLDQNFKNNSYLTLINTNVQRFGTADDANVGGTVFSFNDQTNTYNGSGKFIHSYQTDVDGEVEQGFQSAASLRKISGNFNFYLENEVISDKYDHNDLGVIFRNNSINNSFGGSYSMFEPRGIFNRVRAFFNTSFSHRYSDKAFQDFAMNLDIFSVTKTFFAMGTFTRLEPVITYDYFEPRVDGRYLEYPTNWLWGGWMSTDYRKPFAFDARYFYRKFNQEGRDFHRISFEPRYRVNDKLFFEYEATMFISNNDLGWSTFLNDNSDSIIMGRRQVFIHEHELSASYIFNNKMGLSFRARHFWQTAKYNNFFLLGQDGTLQNTDYTGMDDLGNPIHDVSFNAFNIDCIFNWQFAPGSFLTAVWKNSILRAGDFTEERFFENLKNTTIESPQTNAFSVKALFFVDYLKLKQLSNRNKQAQ